jgi:transcriptional regulator with XRE-family HTH domain
MTEQPSTFGRDLLARARARGVTGEEVATLLGLPVATIRQLSGAHELDRHAAATLRALARRLDLPWPPWLDTAPCWPPAAPGTRSDTARVHAVLAAAFGHALRLGEIAHVLGWTIDRVRAAVTPLIARTRHDGGTRLHADEDALALELAPGLLDDDTRRRLSHVLVGYGSPHELNLLHLVYRTIDKRGRGPGLLYKDPGLLDEACVLGLLTRDIDEATGTVTDVELHPDVKFSLGITQYRYPPEDSAGPACPEP